MKRIRRATSGDHQRKLGPDLVCPYLVAGQFFIYGVRPLICRLWGLVKAMRCPHGCEPEQWLSDEEARAMLARVIQL
ncbi:MAG TPA: hypothetical protein VG206_08280 [Terriglobia bacterium]|nr:hypothetical protein [Terriglobia bacterium]